MWLTFWPMVFWTAIRWKRVLNCNRSSPWPRLVGVTENSRYKKYNFFHPSKNLNFVFFTSISYALLALYTHRLFLLPILYAQKIWSKGHFFCWMLFTLDKPEGCEDCWRPGPEVNCSEAGRVQVRDSLLYLLFVFALSSGESGYSV